MNFLKKKTFFVADQNCHIDLYLQWRVGCALCDLIDLII